MVAADFGFFTAHESDSMVASVTERFTPSDINTETTNIAPDVAVNAAGHVAAFWSTAGGRLAGRIHDESGAPVTGLLDIDRGGDGLAQGVGVTALENGNFLATWTVRSDQLRDGPNNAAVVPAAQVFAADGTPQTDTFALAQQARYIGPDDDVVVAPLSDDQLLASWVTQGSNEDDQKLVGRRLTSEGTPLDAPYTIQTEDPLSGVGDVDAAGLENGGAVLVWDDNLRDEEGVENFVAIRAEIVDANGQTVRDRFLINETTVGDQSDPAVGALANGGFAVAWQDIPENASVPVTVQTRAFTAAGDGLGNETELAAPDNAGTTPTVTGTADGSYTVAWANANDAGIALELRQAAANGEPLGASASVAPTGANQVPELSARPGGGAALAWQSASEIGSPDTSIEVALLGQSSGATNMAPSAADDTGTTAAGETVALDVLANDSDPDGDTLVLDAVGTPADGNAQITDSGETGIAYTPDAGFVGMDTFTYTVGDGNGNTASANVDIEVTAADSGNDVPSDLPAIAGDLFVRANQTVSVANRLEVFGRSGGNEAIEIAQAVRGVELDANLERIDLSNALADYTFQVTDLGLQAFANDGMPVITMPSANQAVEIRFQDGSASLTQTGASTFDVVGIGAGDTIDGNRRTPDLSLDEGTSATALSTVAPSADVAALEAA